MLKANHEILLFMKYNLKNNSIILVGIKFSAKCREIFLQLFCLLDLIYFHQWIFISSHQRGVLRKRMFLEISQNSQENTYARESVFKNASGLKPATLLKKRPWHRCFYVSFEKYLKTPFLKTTSGRLFLEFKSFKMIGRIFHK